MFGQLYLGNDRIELLKWGAVDIHFITVWVWDDVHKQYVGDNVFKILRR